MPVNPHRVALFTPLPPAETGTADYAASLISELEKLVNLHVFERVPRGFKPESFDALIYQIGNNPFHAAIYELALKHPGVVVLHEANVHDLVRGLTRGQERVYFREVVYEIFGRELEELPDHDLIEPVPQPRAFTITKRLLDRSKGCIVHSRFVADEVRLAGFQGRVARIPHGSQVRNLDGSAYRSRMGIGPAEPVIGMFGYQRPDKLACDCLLAFRTVLDDLPQAKLVVAGQPHPEVPLDERVRVLGLQDSVHLCGFQSLENLDGYIAACDVVLNLRWPTYGETSGVMMRAFGLGKTLVVSDNGANLDLPDEICAKIPVDKFQTRVVAECVRWLLSDRKITAQIGRAAQEWVASTCSWGRVARMYADFLFPSTESPHPADASEKFGDPGPLRDYIGGWVEPQSNGWRHEEKHMCRLIKTLQMTPRGNESERILEMGCSLQITPALRELWGYGEVRGCHFGSGGNGVRITRGRDGESFECVIDLFDTERDIFPYGNNYFDTVLCCESLEYLAHDPMRMMGEIHRILKPGGRLLLTAPNAVSSRAIFSLLSCHHAGNNHRYPHPSKPATDDRGSKRVREYTPAEIARLFCDSGFIVSRIETGAYNEDPFPESDSVTNLLARSGRSVHLRDDCIFALGRKAALPRNRYPSWLYGD